MLSQFDDEQLIHQARADNNLDAFNTLVLRYQDYVYSIAARILNDPASAADAAQETFLAAYQKLDTFRGGNFRAWLARIVTNQCYDSLRRVKRQRSDYIEEMTEFYDEPDLPNDTLTPEEQAQQSDLSRALENCISKLNDDQRAVLVLCDVHEMSYQEIAEAVGTAIGTVRSRLSRARAAMQRCLQTTPELLPSEYRLVNDDD